MNPQIPSLDPKDQKSPNPQGQQTTVVPDIQSQQPVLTSQGLPPSELSPKPKRFLNKRKIVIGLSGLLILILLFCGIFLISAKTSSGTPRISLNTSSFTDPGLGYSISPPHGWLIGPTDKYGSGASIQQPYTLTSWSQPGSGIDSINIETFPASFNSLSDAKDTILGYNPSNYQNYQVNSTKLITLHGYPAYLISDSFLVQSGTDSPYATNDIGIIEYEQGIAYYVYGYYNDGKSALISSSINSFLPSTEASKINSFKNLANNGGSNSPETIGVPGDLQPSSTPYGTCDSDSPPEWAFLAVSNQSICQGVSYIAWQANGSDYTYGGYSCKAYTVPGNSQWSTFWNSTAPGGKLIAYTCSGSGGQIAFTWLSS